MRTTALNWLTILTIVFIILGILFAGIGFHKMLVYEGSEYSWRESKNAYVGGDAYNYIINGTYFSGFSALSGAMFICAVICLENLLKLMVAGEDKRLEDKRLSELLFSSEKSNSNLPDNDKDIGAWTCPNCGEINSAYVGTCKCGCRKP